MNDFTNNPIELRKEDLLPSDALRQDAGAKAAERMRDRAAKAARKAARMTLYTTCFFIVLAAMIIGGIGYAGWSTRITGFAVDERPCSYDLQGMPLTGKRTYSYRWMEIFNFRFVDTRVIEEKTVLDVSGTPITIIGQYDELPKVPKTQEASATGESSVVETEVPAVPVAKWWGVNVEQGERGVQVLKPAHTYTFVSGKKMGVVEYKSFCR